MARARVEVSVHHQRAPDDGARLVVASTLCTPGPLTFDARLGFGVRAKVDVLQPDHLCRITAPDPGRGSNPVLEALLGRAVTGEGRVRVDLDAARPWLRVAVVDALDRWLHLPLDQDLVEAERGVARLWAARTLPSSNSAADAVLSDALHLARRGAAGLVRNLRRLTEADLPESGPVRAALASLVEGYDALTQHVSGSDRELCSVVRAWRSVATPGPARRDCRRRRADREWSSPLRVLDPRSVRARVLALSGDPAEGEVEVSAAGHDRAVVRVPAFHAASPEALAHPLLVRLVDRESVPRSHGVLAVPAAARRSRSRVPVFEGTLPLYGAAAADLRVDVYDPLVEDAPPVTTDEGILDARRAVVLLAQRRRLALTRSGTGPAGVDAGSPLVAEWLAMIESGEVPR